MADDKVRARGGESLQLFGQTSLRELTVVVDGVLADPDGEGAFYLDAELELERAQVVHLRDQLSEWLARGEL